MALYDNLPGFEVEVHDGNLTLPAEASVTQTVLIIAPPSSTGVAGPYEDDEYDPVSVSSQTDFESKDLGIYDSTNPIARLWKQAYDAGCGDIRVVKLKGVTPAERYGFLHDIFYVLEESITADIVVVGGVYADDTVGEGVTFVYQRTDFSNDIISTNQNYTAVTNEVLGIGDGIKTEFTIQHFPVLSDISVTKYVGTTAPIFNTGAFTAIADSDSGKTVVFRGVTATVKTAASPVTVAASSATAGTITIANTATAASTATAFKDVFDAIKLAYPESNIATFTFTVQGDSLVITGAVLDGALYNTELITGTATFTNKTNQTQLTTPGVGSATSIAKADFTIDLAKGTIGIASAKAPELGARVQASYKYYSFNFAAQLAGFCETVSAKNKQVLGIMALKPPISSNLSTVKTYVDAQKTQFYSKFLQVIGGSPLWFNIGSNVYEDMWHGAYAGYMSLLPSYSSPTAKAIPGALLASYKLSPSQILSLVNKHIVVPRVRNGKIMVADAVTSAADSSDFVRLTTLRIVNDAVTLVRNIAEPYIGEANSLAKRNALDTAIKTGLQGMVTAGALNDFNFSIKSTVADQIQGTLRIYLDLVPVFETRRILMSLAVKPSL
jgi:hypothetical protein